MKKNGFTVMELVTVIAVLSIIGLISIPKISKAFQTSRADQLESVREEMVKATEVYLNDNCGKAQYQELINNDYVRVYLNSINTCGLIEDKIYNAVNGEYFNIDEEYVDAYIDEVGFIDYRLSF